MEMQIVDSGELPTGHTWLILTIGEGPGVLYATAEAAAYASIARTSKADRNAAS